MGARKRRRIPELASKTSRELGDLVTAALMHSRDDIDHPIQGRWCGGAFNTMFATLVMRIAYGPTFVTPPTTRPSWPT